MNSEGEENEQKSIRYAIGKTQDMDGLACDCVGFANARGGVICLGIEDGEELPPATQRIPADLIHRIRKRIPQITENVAVNPRQATALNGGEYVELRVSGNAQSIASTSDGRYFIRIADETKRLLPDELSRLFADRNSFTWELHPVRRAPVDRLDPGKLRSFEGLIRASDRVSEFVKRKTAEELLEHYSFVRDGVLTNLGVLWLGRRREREALHYAPAIQCIKFDEGGRKVRKFVWDDYSLNPMELIAAVWQEVPDWKESYEIPAGLFRKNVPHYEEVVVRELLANALVHRPYTQRGDIFLNLHPDRLEVHNPGLLPVGVTPRNILHVTNQRNLHLARVFYDLKLMEREGSGFDRMYEVLLSSGRPAPEVVEGDDRVVVTVRKPILKPELIDFMTKADGMFQPGQKELIALGFIAQNESLTARQLQQHLALRSASEVDRWIGRLRKWGLIDQRGRTQATEYFVDPAVLRKLEFKGGTTLRGIESHRLRELVLRDLQIYDLSRIGAIHDRIGKEIPRRNIQRVLAELVKSRLVQRSGIRRGTRYRIAPPPSESGGTGANEGGR